MTRESEDDPDPIGAIIGLVFYGIFLAICFAGSAIHFVVGRPLRWLAITRPTTRAINPAIPDRSRKAAAVWVVNLPFISHRSRANCGYTLAQMWAKEGDLGKSYDMYTRIRTKWDDVLTQDGREKIDLERARLLKELGRVEEAIILLNTLLEIANGPDVRLQASIASAELLEPIRPDEALSHYHCIVSFGKTAPAAAYVNACMRLAKVATTQGKYGDAFDLFVRALHSVDDNTNEELSSECARALSCIARSAADLRQFAPQARRGIAVSPKLAPRDRMILFVAICDFFHRVGDTCAAELVATRIRATIEEWHIEQGWPQPDSHQQLNSDVPPTLLTYEQYLLEPRLRPLDEVVWPAFVSLYFLYPESTPDVRTICDEALRADVDGEISLKRFYDRALEAALARPILGRGPLLCWVAGHHFLSTFDSRKTTVVLRGGRHWPFFEVNKAFLDGSLDTINQFIPCSRYSDEAVRTVELTKATNELMSVKDINPSVIESCTEALTCLLREKPTEAERHYETAIACASETPNTAKRMTVLCILAKHMARAGVARRAETAISMARRACDPLGETMQKLQKLVDLVDLLDRDRPAEFEAYREAYVEELCQLAWKFWQGGGYTSKDRAYAEHIFLRFRGKDMKRSSTSDRL